MSICNKNKSLSYSSPMYSNDVSVSGEQNILAKSKASIATRVPYGRKRSCWKKKHADDDHTPVVHTYQKSVGEAGVITCAICGIQRFYKFIKQTKKFGLHSCEPCRKFISSTISCVKNGERLHFTCSKKGPENCLALESLMYDGTPKSKKDALSNIRCKACWLAMCLEKYQMPIGLRNSLAQFISEDDRPAFSASDMEISYNNGDYNQFTKRRSQNNGEEKSCLRVLCDNFLEDSGLNETMRDKKKVVILRIKC